MMCACIAKERSIGRGSAHNSSPTQVLERSTKLSKDEIILRLGDGKTIAAEAVGSLSLVSNLIMTTQHKRKVDNHENAQIWHARLDHISKDRIKKLLDSRSLEIDNLDHLPTCESRLKGKMTKKPFVGQSAITNSLLDLVYTDTCGPLNTPARGEFSYFITFIDDHSRYSYVYLMRYKSEAFGRFKEYRLEVENQNWPQDKSPLVGPRWFIGYPKETTGYYFYDPSEKKIFVLRNAVFLEKGFSSDSRWDEVLLEESSEELRHDSTTSFEPPVLTDGVPILRRSTRESRAPKRYGFVELTNSMGSNQVWTLVDPPKGVRPVGCKWVYKRKLEADGEVTAFKARLVAKGYTQRPGVNFEETNSPVAMAKSIRILLAIGTWYDYEIWQMDVKMAFLNGFVEEEIYMDQPEGFTTIGEEQKVYHLQRSIYGLKQASRSWNTHFDEVIRGYDFIKNEHDPCVYKKINRSSIAYLVLYVDDILLIGMMLRC
ncbi:UNVERIFIED_CONTAM: Retrovirus-related Pol polyprotein from transposon RE2 [Sesamum latifolium]|uniref:Retrovirus-related Pol polyprotein from transposon RE2 n=1 Tax=Sesamum latifolium TaxID=2727402 RepID=A0AAW2U2B0_9LAMI